MSALVVYFVPQLAVFEDAKKGCLSVNVSFFQELLNNIGERGRSLLDRTSGQSAETSIVPLCEALISSRGEASGVAIASQILDVYEALDREGQSAFFHFLLDNLTPDEAVIVSAAESYLDTPSPANLSSLTHAVESPRQKFFRRLNLAPGATARIVAMREDLIEHLAEEP